MKKLHAITRDGTTLGMEVDGVQARRVINKARYMEVRMSSDQYINALEDVYEMIDETINALSLLIFIAPEEDFDYLKSVALLLGRALNTLEVLK